MRNPPTQPSPGFTCEVPINTGPQTFVLRAAVVALNRWVEDGTPPPHSPRMETTNTTPPQFVVDADGIVRGGIRTPAVDAPVATLSGLGQSGGTQFCNIFGSTVPFTQQQLRAHYRNHGRFTSAWAKATHSAVEAGFLLAADARQLLVVGAQSNILK
jgi:hypothetical protein